MNDIVAKRNEEEPKSKSDEENMTEDSEEQKHS